MFNASYNPKRVIELSDSLKNNLSDKINIRQKATIAITYEI